MAPGSKRPPGSQLSLGHEDQGAAVALTLDVHARFHQGVLQPAAAGAVADEQAALARREPRLEIRDQSRRLLGGAAIDQTEVVALTQAGDPPLELTVHGKSSKPLLQTLRASTARQLTAGARSVRGAVKRKEGLQETKKRRHGGGRPGGHPASGRLFARLRLARGDG